MSQSVDASRYADHLEQKAESSEQQIGNRTTIVYMGNRLEEAKVKLREAEKALARSPQNTHYQLEKQDAEAAIAHWSTEIDETGGMITQAQVKKGDFIHYIGKWYQVIRVSKKTVTITGWIYATGTYTVPYHKITKYMSAETAQAEIDRRAAEATKPSPVQP